MTILQPFSVANIVTRTVCNTELSEDTDYRHQSNFIESYQKIKINMKKMLSEHRLCVNKHEGATSTIWGQ